MSDTNHNTVPSKGPVATTTRGRLPCLEPTTHEQCPYQKLAKYLREHNYRIGKIVAKGGYSKVYEIHEDFSDGTSETEIALKFINTKNSTPSFVNRFVARELKMVLKLKHPHIIETYDVQDFSTNKYIFMKYCKNGTVLELIERGGRLAENMASQLFRQIVSALQYMHGLGLAHRDIKCENIFIDSDFTLKLGDFGFSRDCKDARGMICFTRTHCGSTAYASPELQQRKGLYQPMKLDMWALGCVLFIMVSGKAPFTETFCMRLVDDQLNRNYQFSVRPSAALRDCVSLMLEPDVDERANIQQIVQHDFTLGLALPVDANASENIPSHSGSRDVVTTEHNQSSTTDVNGLRLITTSSESESDIYDDQFSVLETQCSATWF